MTDVTKLRAEVERLMKEAEGESAATFQGDIDRLRRIETERDVLRAALEVIAKGKRHKAGNKIYEELSEFFARDVLDALRESGEARAPQRTSESIDDTFRRHGLDPKNWKP